MRPTLVLLPGLGADARVFSRQQAAFPGLVVPSWPEFQAGDSLPQFASRLVRSVPPGAPLYLGGSSFGGMVALELAALLRPQAVLLIGSCVGPESLAPLAHALRPLASFLPSAMFQPRPWALPLVLPTFGRLTRPQREVFWTMAKATPAPFLKWGVNAILSWKPSRVESPVHHIHGSLDRLIPIKRANPTVVVVGGGHLLPLTHPDEVTAFLSRVLSHGIR